jgi:hypothetical protein
MTVKKGHSAAKIKKKKRVLLGEGISRKARKWEYN